MKKQRFGHPLWVFVCALVLLTEVATSQTPAAAERWLATWGTAFQQPSTNSTFNNQTVRMFTRVSIGGRRVRLQLANLFGTTPIVLGPVHIALHGQGSAIVNGSDRPVLFSGKTTAKIAPGSVLVSDAVNLDVPALGDLAIQVRIGLELIGVRGD